MAAPELILAGTLPVIARSQAQIAYLGLGEPTFMVGSVNSTATQWALTLTAPDDIGILSFAQNVSDPAGLANDSWLSSIQTQTRVIWDGSALTTPPIFQQVALPFQTRGFIKPIYLAQGSTIRFEARRNTAGALLRNLSVAVEAYLWTGKADKAQGLT